MVNPFDLLPKVPETTPVKPTETPPPKKISVDPEIIIVVPGSSDIKEGFTRLNILNSCSFPVALGVTGSYQSKTSDGQCDGENVTPNKRGDTCFFTLKDSPDTLDSSESWSIDMTSVTPKDDHIFSGNVWATKVDQMVMHCPTGKCPVYVGPRAGLTKAEFTLSTSNVAYYDVSNIEAVSIPTAMYPVGVKQDEYYENGVAGGGTCTWDFDPGRLEKFHTWIINPTGETCETKSDCPKDSRCGASFATSPPTFGQCGEFNGYITAHLACISGAKDGPWDCENNADTISCMHKYSANSGYTNGLKDGVTVCGCPDWESMGLDAPPKYPCKASDKVWEEKSLPFLKFIKEGCLNGYTFAYDDSTSLFTSSKGANEFTVEFCPGDSEGVFFD